MESAAEPPTSPPESASGVESATGLVRGGHSTGPPRSRSESAADFKVRLESAGVRSESAGVRKNSFESIRNIFWRRSAGLRAESGGSAGVRSESARSPAARSPAAPRSPRVRSCCAGDGELSKVVQPQCMA